MGRYVASKKQRRKFINTNWRKSRTWGEYGEYLAGKAGAMALGFISDNIAGALSGDELYTSAYNKFIAPKFKRRLSSRIQWRRKGQPWRLGVGSNPPRNVIGVNPGRKGGGSVTGSNPPRNVIGVNPGGNGRKGTRKYKGHKRKYHRRGIRKKVSFK